MQLSTLMIFINLFKLILSISEQMNTTETINYSSENPSLENSQNFGFNNFSAEQIESAMNNPERILNDPNTLSQLSSNPDLIWSIQNMVEEYKTENGISGDQVNKSMTPEMMNDIFSKVMPKIQKGEIKINPPSNNTKTLAEVQDVLLNNMPKNPEKIKSFKEERRDFVVEEPEEKNMLWGLEQEDLEEDDDYIQSICGSSNEDFKEIIKALKNIKDTSCVTAKINKITKNFPENEIAKIFEEEFGDLLKFIN